MIAGHMFWKSEADYYVGGKTGFLLSAAGRLAMKLRAAGHYGLIEYSCMPQKRGLYLMEARAVTRSATTSEAQAA
jgi:hypothetical protein